MRNYIVIVLFILLSVCHLAHGQDNRPIIEILDSLNYGTEMPEGILQSKSLVLVDVPPLRTDPYVRGNWQAMADEAQPGFRKAGIDAVVYYHIDDIYSGKESFRAFIDNFKDREIKNVVFLIREGNKNKIVLTKIHDDSHLIVVGQPAWKVENIDLSVALNNLYRTAANSSQKRENLLITEVPEFGNMPQVIKARRGEYYDLNFGSEKLAVPQLADTAEINRMMTQYPYEYGIVDRDKDEKQIRSDGYQYILYYVHATGKEVKEMLEYPVTETETAYITEVVNDGKTNIASYNINTPVYKFYIKHIYSGNVFLGKRWDAAPTWQEALSNYLNNLSNELVRD